MAPKTSYLSDGFDLFDELFNQLSTWDAVAHPVVSQLPKHLVAEFPPCDLEVEEDKSLIYSFAVAGYPEEAISVSYEDEYLVLSLESQNKDTKDTRKFIQKRIKKGEVKAKYHVPLAKYDIQHIKVTLKDGILTVRVPVKEDQKPVKILISK